MSRSGRPAVSISPVARSFSLRRSVAAQWRHLWDFRVSKKSFRFAAVRASFSSLVLKENGRGGAWAFFSGGRYSSESLWLKDLLLPPKKLEGHGLLPIKLCRAIAAQIRLKGQSFNLETVVGARQPQMALLREIQ